MHISPIPPKSDKIAWKILITLINFLVGKLPTISHTIIGANETGNTTAYLKKSVLPPSISTPNYIYTLTVSHTNPTPPPTYTNPYPSPILIDHDDDHHSKNTVIRSIHLLNNSPFQVRFCEPLNNSQLLARKVSISTINHLNSSHPIPNFNYVIRGTNNFHIALIACVPPDIVIP